MQNNIRIYIVIKYKIYAVILNHKFYIIMLNHSELYFTLISGRKFHNCYFCL